MSNKPTVAIVGAGVVGLCTAIKFQQAGFTVTLFDKSTPAKQASFGNASYIAAEYMTPLAAPSNIISAIKNSFSKNAAFKVTPDHLLKFVPWSIKFLQSSLEPKLQNSKLGIEYLNKRCVDAWKDILHITGNSDALINCGFIKLFEKKSDLKAAQKAVTIIKRSGFDVELLQGNSLFEKEPNLSKSIQHGIYYPSVYKLPDTYDVCLNLFNYFSQSGGKFIQQAVENVQPVEIGVKVTTIESGSDFDKTIITAGVWSKSLLQDLGLAVPLAAERGYHLTLSNITHTPRNIIESIDRHVVINSVNSGMRIVGFGEYGNVQTPAIAKRYQQLRYHLEQIFSDIDIDESKSSTWMGIRPTLPDSLPVIDLHPKFPQIGMAFGHHHVGVTQAAISAQLITSLMNNNDVDDDVKRYSVTRFL